MVKKALGRGLDALIRTPSPTPVTGGKGKASFDPATGEAVQRVPIDQVIPSPFQPRKKFNEEHLKELVESIREHGIIQPLIVRDVDGKLELIAGERRWRACQRLELTEVPVIVRTASDKDVVEMALIENLQREDLNPIEEAEAYARLSREFGLKQEEIAQRVGKNRATVSNTIRLLDLEISVRDLVSQNMISTGHAKAILGIKGKAEKKMVADMVVRKQLNVRATEKLVTEHINGRTSSKKTTTSKLPKQVENYVRDIEDRLRSRFATNIHVNHGDKKGKIEIEYFGNDDLGRILELLGIPVE